VELLRPLPATRILVGRRLLQLVRTLRSFLLQVCFVPPHNILLLMQIPVDGGEGYITVEGHAGDRNDLKAWHGGVSASGSECIGNT